VSAGVPRPRFQRGNAHEFNRSHWDTP
jgi:hypothetical protein